MYKESTTPTYGSNLQSLKKIALNQDETKANAVLNDDEILKKFDKGSLLQIARAHQHGAMKILTKFPEIFSSEDLISIAKRFHGVALHIDNFNDPIKNKIDSTRWQNEVMSKHCTLLENNADSSSQGMTPNLIKLF